ncbi:FAD-dependent oxidoreductase [Pseudofrankia asymbiotica]|uniref:Salicylate hydroxylase n=1 Tax=Pseudofrankia asymbiotica TaxID=1834516 RepID=A0A1V2I7P3_9ACTN|nr:FAD-dependent monooxygenase [Pseudofrankia asymbiotica]ONH28064.1 salicylate hydroxylase [Pseudofrankia asymbiotica]
MSSATSPTPPPGRIAVLGAGPAGMATALGAIKAGHAVTVYERYREARPAGNILNLWPPPLKALGLLGVDTADLGAPTDSQFRNARGKVRVDVKQDADVRAAYGGGFIGLLRPELYERMLAAIPLGVIEFGQQVDRIEQDERAVTLHFSDGTTAEHDVLVGADGIDSLVRRTLWGDAPKREHRLQALGGFTLDKVDGTTPNTSVIGHNRTIQGSWTSIRHKGRDGNQWWVLNATDPDAPAPPDLKAVATRLATGFPEPLPGLIAVTEPQNMQRWVLRDREPLGQWSKGRITLAGDAAHPTSPYAAYGAGMSIEDGYFIGRTLRGLDLTDLAAVRAALQSYEDRRKPHTRYQVQQAWRLGKIFHHLPAPLRPLRDLVFDHTPFLQKVAGDANPKMISQQLALIVD